MLCHVPGLAHTYHPAAAPWTQQPSLISCTPAAAALHVNSLIAPARLDDFHHWAGAFLTLLTTQPPDATTTAMVTATATATTTAKGTTTTTATDNHHTTAPTAPPPSLATVAPLLPAFFLFVSLTVEEAKRDLANFYVAALGRALAQVFTKLWHPPSLLM